MQHRNTVPQILSCFVSMLFATTGFAEGWRGWMGDEQDGVYRETGIIDRIPDTGLSVKWRTPIHGGYAGPAVAAGRVFVFDYQ